MVQLEFNLTLACSALAYICTNRASICKKLTFFGVRSRTLQRSTPDNPRERSIHYNVHLTNTHGTFEHTLLKPSQNNG